MVDAMLEQDATADDIQLWITSFSQQYDETMQYNESGLYGVIRGQGVYSSGWQPEPQYNIFERPWYLQAVAANGECARSMVYEDARTGTRMVSLSKLLSDGESVLGTGYPGRRYPGGVAGGQRRLSRHRHHRGSGRKRAAAPANRPGTHQL